MDINFKNLEVRLKDGFCNLVEFNKGHLFYIKTNVPEEKSHLLECLLLKDLPEKKFYEDFSKLVVKPSSDKLQLQNYKEKQYPVGLFLSHKSCDQKFLHQEHLS